MKQQITVSPPVTDNGEAVKSPSTLPRVISYIPYGEIFVEQQSGGWQSPYLFNAKELDSETGLYYYGARYLDPSEGMWLSVDPLWEKYAGMTPYGYCAGNPVGLVDVDGREIEEESKDEWNKNRVQINEKIDYLQNEIGKYQQKAQQKSWSDEKLKKKTGRLNERLSWLNAKNKQLDELENSSQTYRLKKVGDNEPKIGDVSLNPADNVIEIRYFSVANFVHETTHATQFEVGNIAFLSESGKTLFYDILDEAAAYSMEYAYSGQSYNVTQDFIRNLMAPNGDLLYAKHPSISVGVYSSVLTFDLAMKTNYRHQFGDPMSALNTNLKSFFNNIYAK